MITNSSQLFLAAGFIVVIYPWSDPQIPGFLPGNMMGQVCRDIWLLAV